MQTFDADVLFDPPSEELKFLPEGPISLGEGRFSWVAIQHGAEATTGSLNLFDMRTRENRSFPLDGRPGFAFPAGGAERFLVGLERRLVLFDCATGEEELLTEGIDAGVEGTIINDGTPFEGGVLFGTKDLEFAEKKAGLYFWRKSDRKLISLRNDQICSNGKVVLAQDGGVEFLDIDTPTKQVVRYRLDPESGELSGGETVLDLTSLEFFPDGMVGTPDDGGAIISFYNPNEAPFGETRWYDLASGECRAVWRTPGSPQATCPLLIEDEGAVKLVITTAVENMPSARRAAAPGAGCLFIADAPFESLFDDCAR